MTHPREPEAVPLPRLIEGLSDPAAYPHGAADLEVHQTHISAVFLAGAFAYKLKKPITLEFLDYSTRGLRKHYCEEEVRLNRRLAPGVYLGVVPVTRAADGRLTVEGAGDVVDWAVKMKRLPPAATFAAKLGRGELTADDLKALACRVAAFHREAESGETVAAFARYPAVERNARDNFETALSTGQVGEGKAVSSAVFERVRALTEGALEALRPAIERRADDGFPRDTHGDLRLDHVYQFPDRPPPDDLAVIDGIEFNEKFRYADPAAEVAFTAMDLIAGGRRDLARVLSEAYVEASGDAGVAELLPYYVAYRAVVRAKVEGIKAAEPEVTRDDRAAALATARAHWMVALGALEGPGRRPCLLLVGGLPGAGKSTLCRGLAERAGFAVVRSDEVRKGLAGVAGDATSGYGEGIYTPEWTDRTYDRCLELAEAEALRPGRVIVDANFREDGRRRAFLDAGRRWGIPAVFLHCVADPETTRRRLESRAGAGDASDADWSVYERAAARWEAPGPAVSPHTVIIDTSGSADETIRRANEALRGRGLLGESTAVPLKGGAG